MLHDADAERMGQQKGAQVGGVCTSMCAGGRMCVGNVESETMLPVAPMPERMGQGAK